MQVTNTVTSLLRSEIQKVKFYSIGLGWKSETFEFVTMKLNSVGDLNFKFVATNSYSSLLGGMG